MSHRFLLPANCRLGFFLRFLLLSGAALAALTARAEPLEFDLPARPAADALLAISKQAKIEVLFSFDELRQVQASAVTGRHEPDEALALLLRGTGFAARRNGKGKFVVTPDRRPTGTIKGRLLNPDSSGAPFINVAIAQTRLATTTAESGAFEFPAVPPGTYQLIASGGGFHPLLLDKVKVEARHVVDLATQTLQIADEVTRLEPFIVVDESARQVTIDRNQDAYAERKAAGNLDLPRTRDDPLPFTIYDRTQINRSGVVDLNEFLQREVLDSDASTRPPDQRGTADSFRAGSTNLNLRGYGADQTVILVNGRRLPESSPTSDGQLSPPDVNFIPLSLVQQVEVLPVSASALYAGNAVGGVINIVLRPDADATEITTTYTNAVGRYDAPQLSAALQHGQTFLHGKLHVRLSATFTKVAPPTERELRLLQTHDPVSPATALDDAIFRATPNVRSADLSPLFGTGTSPVTSVAPAANGTGGLAAFAGRQGVRNFSFFDSPGGLAASLNSLDHPFGRRQKRATYFGSAVYDFLPWLQLGLDGVYSRTVVNRGFDVLAADLTLAAANPLNPFGQDVKVALNETAPLLGENYSEARLESYSAVLGLLLKLPAEWKVSLDAQYARNITNYRGVFDADPARWQQLVDSGVYQPLRDTQVHGPPQEFYDRVLTYYGRPGHFLKLGDYDTLDAALRVSNLFVPLPTGLGALNLGGDYRRNHLADYTEAPLFADGSPARTPIHLIGRTLQRMSVFGEFQAPLVPARLRPHWLRNVEADIALRYVASAESRETNFAPTYGLKADFAGGLSFRGSITTSNRFPTPSMTRQAGELTGTGSGIELTRIFDPVRGELRDVQTRSALDPNLRPEGAVTQTAGLIFQRGKVHRVRASLDFVDTRKVNELIPLDAQAVLNLETLFPARVVRAPLAPGDSRPAGAVQTVLTGTVNVAKRHSQNWNAAVDYAWSECFGGKLEVYGRLVYYPLYVRQVFPISPVIDELNQPDGLATGLLQYRANFGASWSDRDTSVGLDGHYFHSRLLPLGERPSQHNKQINPYWQFDAFVQRDLTRWLPWKNSRFGLRGQLRVNNVLAAEFPRYANDPTGAGVQPYGDWRGRVYSLSLTATF